MKEEDKKSSTCSEFNKCLEILYLMLDNEASEEQEDYLNKHFEKCLFCFEQYEVEKQIRELIKTKIAKMPVPAGLATSIKTKIGQFS